MSKTIRSFGREAEYEYSASIFEKTVVSDTFQLYLLYLYPAARAMGKLDK